MMRYPSSRQCMALAMLGLVCVACPPVMSEDSRERAAWPSDGLQVAVAETAQRRQELPPLDPETLDIAKDIGLTDLLNEFLEKRTQAVITTGSPRTLDTVYLHGKIVASLLGTSLQVRGTVAQINEEITKSQELLSSLQQKTQRRTDLAEIFNFMNTGTAETISTGVGLSTKSLRIPAACVGAYGGFMEIALSALALKLAEGGRLDSKVQPNMLAKVFGKDGAELDYPPTVWAYLNDTDPGYPSAETRLQRLVKHWIAMKHMPSPQSHTGKAEIPLLTSSVAKKKGITIDLLNRRIMMLSDLRSTITEMDEQLLKIVLWLGKML